MYQIPELTKFPNFIHAFSQKVNGDLSANFNPESKVIRKREKFLAELDLKLEDCVKMKVVHGNKVVEADERKKGVSMRDWRKSVEADGLVTKEKDTHLFLLVADCLSIILFDPVKQRLGLVHAGWKGTDLNIVGKAVKRLKHLYKTEPGDLVVGLGPAARRDSFIKNNPYQRDNPRWTGFLEKIDDTFYKVDFVGLCKKQLYDSGVKRENVFDSGIDTVKDQRFFSHVREKSLPSSVQGRFACIAGIK
jgi:polyphenol oxidase